MSDEESKRIFDEIDRAKGPGPSVRLDGPFQAAILNLKANHFFHI